MKRLKSISRIDARRALGCFVRDAPCGMFILIFYPYKK